MGMRMWPSRRRSKLPTYQRMGAEQQVWGQGNSIRPSHDPLLLCPRTSLMPSSAARPFCMTGMVNTPAAASVAAKEAAGAAYTSSVMRSWTMAAKAARSATVSGRLHLSRYRRDSSRRETLVMPEELQIDTPFVEKAVWKARRGPTCCRMQGPADQCLVQEWCAHAMQDATT